MKKSKDPFIELSDIEAKQIEWLLEPFIPKGMISILEGDPGLGKSFVAMNLAALITRGDVLPNGVKVAAANVLYLSAEDDNNYTIRPRMEAMGADLDKVVVLLDFMQLDHEGLLALEEEVAKTRPALIVMDPMIAFMDAGADAYRPTVIRPFLNELRGIVEKYNSALLIIRHLAKMRQGNALYQGAGSIDQIGVARSAMRVAKHPDDPNLRVLAHLKHNLSAPGKSLLFEVKHQEGGGAAVAWHGETQLSIGDLDGEHAEEISAVDEAERFLVEQLRPDGASPNDLYRLAEKRNIAKRTLERAKERLRVASSKKKDGWWWSLHQEGKP